MILKLPVEVPDWVKWVTVDRNGSRYMFTHEPTSHESMWIIEDPDDHLYKRFDSVTMPNDFTKELYKVVEGELIKYSPAG